MNKTKIYILSIVLLLTTTYSSATTYYVSTTGSDNNPGTITAPFATWEKLSSVLVAGDIAYIRGGEYRSGKPASSNVQCRLNNLNGTATDSIKIFAYPGETPVLNLDDVVHTSVDVYGFYLQNSNYVHIKGLRVTGLLQNTNGNVLYGFILERSNNCKIELVEVDHIGGQGFFSFNANDILFKNCDVHHCDDRYSNYAWNGSNGFSATGGGNTSTRNTYDGCRAWWISDDGWDFFASDGYFTVKNCWSFWNGYIPGTFIPAGDGVGFKLGPTGTSKSTSLLRILSNNIAAENRSFGFDQNGGDCMYRLTNNTSYSNGEVGYVWGYYPSIPQVFKNNVSFGDPLIRQGSEITGDHNSWNGGVNLSILDFLSILSGGLTGPRETDGGLPDISFLHLDPNSDLIDNGTDVGTPYNGAAPDLGVFEYSTGNQSPTADAGADQTIALPISIVTLNGSGSDPDGTIASYQWTKVAGPVSVSIALPTLPTTLVISLVSGVYQFELKVTDNQGAVDRDTMFVYVNTAPNQTPTANAGADQNITLPINTVTVNGSGSDPDGSINAYAWSKVSGPAATIVSPTQANSVINGLVQGTYRFELRVTDNLGAIGRDTLQVIVNADPNQSPTANAGPNQNITLPVNSLTLNGSGSDPDGTIAAYLWSKLSGPSATIVSATQASTLINSLSAGIYQFELRVTDNQGAFGRDTVQVTVNAAPNQAPTANAGTDQNITLPTNTITVNGSGTDPDGSIASYQWRKLTGGTANIVSATQATSVINNLVQGIYQFELRVTDNQGAIGRDTMVVTVNAAPPNQAPTANAGLDQNITLPTNSITVNGSGTDVDGTIASYQWTKITGGAANIVSATQATSVINNLVQGVYQFELRVTDNQGGIGRDTLVVTVNAGAPNQAPTANAGLDQNITLPTNSITVNGSGTDVDGTIASYQWTKITGGAANIVSATQATSVINNLVQGVYQFELRVTDNQGGIGRDTLVVTVNAGAPNQAPTANAGLDQNITLPTNSITVNGSGTDVDGTIASYQWTKITGGAANIVSATQASSVINNLVQGVYQFELRITDNQGAIGRDTMIVTVNAGAPNQAPTANAGLDQNITLPTNSITVNGSGTDVDGTIASYQWTKITGGAANIVSATQASTVINGLAAGVYQFELRVTDNQGAVGRDTMTVTVNAAPNLPPTANAGLNQNITLPVNSITVNGSANDPDGTIASYLWTKINGPAANIVSPNQASTIINGLSAGVYQFELRVTDNRGAIARDTVLITVNAAAIVNQAPIANAGTGIVIVLPENAVSLSGSATDVDGTIASYSWTKISGPATFEFVAPSSAQTVVRNLVEGVYLFQLKATDNAGATDTDTVQITVEKPLEFKASIFPNPVKNNMNLKIEDKSTTGPSSIIIYDMAGKVMYQESFVRNQPSMVKQIDVTAFRSGTYLVRIMSDSGSSQTIKMIKQ